MAKGLVFDLGNVLVDWAPVRDLQRRGLSADEAALVNSVLFGSQVWLDLDRGIITFEEAMAQALPQLPAHLRVPARDFALNWPEYLEIKTGEVALAERLLAAGYPLYLLSNASAPAVRMQARIPLLREFRGLLFSFEVQLMKPEAQIYHEMARRFGLRLEDCFFVDDSAANIRGAAAVGLDGYHYQNDLSALKENLRQRGFDWEETWQK